MEMRDIPVYSSLFEESEWSFKEHLAIENATAKFGLGTKLFYDNVLQTLPGKSMEDIRKKGMSLINQRVPMTDDPMPRNNIGERELVVEGTGKQGMDQIVEPHPQEVQAMDQVEQTEVPSEMERKRRVAWTDPYDEGVFSMGGRRRRRRLKFGREDERWASFGRGDGRGILRYPRQSGATKVLSRRGHKLCGVPINQLIRPVPIDQIIRPVHALGGMISSLIPTTPNHHVEVTAAMMNSMTIRDGAPPPFNRNIG